MHCGPARGLCTISRLVTILFSCAETAQQRVAGLPAAARAAHQAALAGADALRIAVPAGVIADAASAAEIARLAGTVPCEWIDTATALALPGLMISGEQSLDAAVIAAALVGDAEAATLLREGGGIAGTLSGGNQQKVVLGKWLLTGPKVLFLDEPTRGIDVGAKQEIYAEINKLSEQGLAIVLVSSELPEVLGLADRIIVLHEGKMTGEFLRQDATPEKVMTAATGHA